MISRSTFPAKGVRQDRLVHFAVATQPPAGKLSFELPEKDLSIRINGSSTVFRKVTQGDAQSLELPIDKGGDIAVTWQPEQARRSTAAVVQVDSALALTIADAGCGISQGVAYRIRQGGLADASFSLPDPLRLQSVSGPDVGGWELQGEGAGRRVRIIFRRNVTDQTRLTINAFLDVKVGTAATSISVPQIAPLQVTNEIGQIAVYAGNQFSLRAEQADSLSQIDGDKFADSSAHQPSECSAPTCLSFFETSIRFDVASNTSRIAITRRCTTSGFDHSAQTTYYQSTALQFDREAPRSSLSVTLPENFVLLDVDATAMRDWYVVKQDGTSLLTIELTGPRLGQIEAVISGFVASENLAGSVTFPLPVDVTKLESTAAIWLDDGLSGTLETFEGWRSIDTSLITHDLSTVRTQQTARFAFSSTSATPSAITLQLTQSMPKLTGDGLSMVTVTDVGVVYTLALQWQIDSAKTDTLTLTTPNWLQNKLDFRAARTAGSDVGRRGW